MIGCEKRLHAGFTLLELLVVLIVMGITTAIVAPALLPPNESLEPEIAPLLRGARETASRRGETLYLNIASSGQWRLDGAASIESGAVATGLMGDYLGPEATLVVSPIGTCAFDVWSNAAAQSIRVDPLTCEVRSP